MTQSAQLTFASGQVVPLPNDTSAHTVDLTDTLDQGAPQTAVYGKVPLSQDIGNGGLVPVVGSAIFPSAAKANYKFRISTSTDNSTWTVLGSDIFDNSLGIGAQKLPSGIKRYIKMSIVFTCTVAPGANKTATVNGSIGGQVSTYPK